MSTRKKCKLVHADTLTSPATTATRDPIDWSICALCQEPSSKPLNCPDKSKRTDIGAGYGTLGDTLKSVLQLGNRPLAIDIDRLDEGDGIGSTLASNHAQWHISCRLKCSASRLARAEVTALPTTCIDASGGLPYMLRQAECRNPPQENNCLLVFCGEFGTEATPLHEAMTPSITHRVSQCALKLQDQKLIAQLSQSDLVAQEAKYHANCLVKLYNASNRKTEEDEKENFDRVSHGIALVEPPLPESYTTLTPVTAKKDLIIPPTRGTLTSDCELVNTAMEEEKKWQNNTRRLVSEGVQSVDDPICWAAFHYNEQQSRDVEVTIGSLLPLFPDDSKSVAMIRHAMDVVQRAVHLLNPGQVPVLTIDQPLFAIAKQIHWNWPNEYGEEKFVILPGGLHMEMASLTTELLEICSMAVDGRMLWPKKILLHLEQQNHS